MKGIIYCLAACLQYVGATSFDFPEQQARYDQYRKDAYTNQMAILEKRETGCTSKNVIVRKEWSTLSLDDRKEYIDAVKCLMALPPIIPKDVVPGGRSRFDDFQATHMNQTLWVHISSYFLPWHRYLVVAYENALRNECGYTGTQPYWDWSANNANISANALFSGEGSIGGNGEAIPHNASITTLPTDPPRSGTIPPGTGGGCLIDGPFAGMINNIGPFGPPQSNTSFNYNPRCVRRDFRPDNIRQTMNYANVTDMLATTNLDDFDDIMEGIHATGHAGIGGMNDDLYAGIGDPAFWFHHSQVDHMWTIWQEQDREVRLPQVTRTLTIANSPPSAPGTLDTTMDLGYNGPTYAIRDLISTIDGPFCYIYE